MAGRISSLGLGGGYGPISSIVNASSVATNAINVSSTALNANAVSVASGALTAGVLKTVLNVSGRGRIGMAAAWHINDTTARTVRLKVTIDGVAVFDNTVNNSSGNTAGMVAIGTIAGTLQWVEYKQSLKIEIASSLTETDKLVSAYAHEVWS